VLYGVGMKVIGARARRQTTSHQVRMKPVPQRCRNKEVRSSVIQRLVSAEQIVQPCHRRAFRVKPMREKNKSGELKQERE